MAVEAKDVVVIGGGFAGLSAGVALAERGFRVARARSASRRLAAAPTRSPIRRAATSSITASTC